MKYKDEIITSTLIKISFMDRLRVLFGKTIHISIFTKTENLPGKVKSESRVWVEKIMKQKPSGGYEEKQK